MRRVQSDEHWGVITRSYFQGIAVFIEVRFSAVGSKLMGVAPSDLAIVNLKESRNDEDDSIDGGAGCDSVSGWFHGLRGNR